MGKRSGLVRVIMPTPMPGYGASYIACTRAQAQCSYLLVGPGAYNVACIDARSTICDQVCATAPLFFVRRHASLRVFSQQFCVARIGHLLTKTKHIYSGSSPLLLMLWEGIQVQDHPPWRLPCKIF